MKKIVKLIIFLAVLLMPVLSVQAKDNMVVLPVDIMNVCNNYYCYPEASEILADDIIHQYSRDENVNIVALNEVRAKLINDEKLLRSVVYALEEFEYKNKIDYIKLKALSDKLDAKYLLMISSVVPTANTLAKRSLWEVLEIASVFDISSVYNLNTKVVLVDVQSGSIVWNENYSITIGEKKPFVAKNVSEANSKLDGIRMYFESLISKAVRQGISSRLYPSNISQSVSDVTDVNVDSSEENKKQINSTLEGESLLRMDRVNPVKREINDFDRDEDDIGEMIYGF